MTGERVATTPPEHRAFAWDDTSRVLTELLALSTLVADDRGRGFFGYDAAADEEVRFLPPAVLPLDRYGTDPARYAAALPAELGHHLVVLLQAGAAALGTFRCGELCRHKVIKRYVTRGRGKAQPAYLKSKGKSRYGSRLRLRNARRLLQEVNGQLAAWAGEDGDYELKLYSCPVRQWADLHHAPVACPFPRDEFRRIPRDVRVPSLEELVRAYRSCLWGSVERSRRDAVSRPAPAGSRAADPG